MAFTDSGFGNPQGSSSTSIFSSFGGSSCAGGFRSVSTSSKYVNGKMVRVTKVVENGTETITEEVDGQVTNRTVRQCGNGALQAMYDIRVESLSCVVKSRLAKIMKLRHSCFKIKITLDSENSLLKLLISIQWRLSIND
ncbi:unnamed protein product [Schistosoma haematobium]|nr:unnamed protein product [Schistosoma haematobium]